MPVPTDVRLEVRILLDAGGHLVVQHLPAESAYVLPGGAVEPGEDVDAAAARHVRALSGSHTLVADFAGCIEHPNPGGGRTITMLFAADLPDDADIPTAHLNVPFVLLPLSNRDELPLAPAAVSAATVRWLEDHWPTWWGLPVTESDPWWNQLRLSAHSLRAQLHARRHELADSDFRDAAVAMCALVAAADGTIDAREREAMTQIVTTDQILAAFASDDLVRLFNTHVAALRRDPAAGRSAAFREIAKVRGHRVQARSVVQFGAMIGYADGTFDPDEQAVVRRAMSILGLDPSALSVQATQTVDR